MRRKQCCSPSSGEERSKNAVSAHRQNLSIPSTSSLGGLRKAALVIGGTHDHIHLLRLLGEAGYRTVLVDYHENPVAARAADLHVRASTLDREAVLEIARRERVRLALAFCIDQALPTSAYVSERLGLPCHLSFDRALAATNKAGMKEKFARNGVATARHAVFRDVPDSLPEGFRYPVVVKPADSNSSKGIRKAAAGEELAAAAENALRESRSGEILIEEFIEGTEFSLDAVVSEGRVHGVMLTELVKAPARDNFLIVQSRPLADERGDKMMSACREAQAIADAFEIRNSPLLVQLIHDGRGVRVVEFGARIGGGSKHHQVLASTGVDLPRVFLAQVLGEEATWECRETTVPAAMNYVYARPGKLASFRDADTLLADGIIDGFFDYKSPGMEIRGSLSSADRPCGYLTVAGDPGEMETKIMKADASLGVISSEGTDLMIRGLSGKDGGRQDGN